MKHTPPPERPEVVQTLRVVVFDEPGQPIPSRPHIGLSHEYRPTSTPRIALAHSGLLDELGQALPLHVVADPPKRLARPGTPGPVAPPEEPSPKLKVVGRRRRRSKPSDSTDAPEGAA